MAWFDEVKKDLSIASSGLHGLEIIGSLVKQIDPTNATLEGVLSVVGIIERVVDSVVNGAQGNVSTEEVNDALLSLKSQLAANDAAAQSEIDKKFPK